MLKTFSKRSLAPLLSFLFFISPLVDAESPTSKVATYDQLLSAIRQTRASSQARIETAVEQEKVREVWETGKLISEHILQHKERAEYDREVLVRLAMDLKTSKTELYYMLQFARTYPIFPSTGKLPWGHYRELLSVKDEEKRREVAQEAERNSWTQSELREEIKRRNYVASEATSSKLPEITPGPLYAYQIIRLKDRLKIDLGFGIYRDLSEEDTQRFKEGDIVHAPPSLRVPRPAEGGTRGEAISVLKDVSASDLFTYQALVTSVVDGDTFHALIDLGLGDTLAQRVRLRRIDAPELLTADGKEAKKLLEKILSRDNGRIVMKSVDIDQHGRPIADVWVCTARSVNASAVGTRPTGDECKGKPVDQELLDQGLAVPIRD